MMSGIVSFVLMAAVIEMYEHSNLHKTGAVHHNEVCDRDVRLTVVKQPREDLRLQDPPLAIVDTGNGDNASEDASAHSFLK